MIYKILLIVAAVAAAAGIKFSGDFVREAREATLALESSQKKLTAAQKKEETSAQELNNLIDALGDLSEKDYKEWEEKAETAKNARYAASAESEALSNQMLSDSYDRQRKEIVLNREINSLASENTRLQKEIKSIIDKPVEPLGKDNINRVIEATMNLIRPEGSTREALAELFDDAVLVLGGHMYEYMDDLYNEFQEENQRYAKRARKFISAGVNKSLGRLYIILGYVHLNPRENNPYITDETGYITLVYQFGSSGRVDSRRIDYSQKTTRNPNRPKLPKGYVPFNYTGVKEVVVE